jgi:uncharacterized membrane protein
MTRLPRRLEIASLWTIELVYFGYYLMAGWLRAESFVIGGRDSAILQTALWQAGQLQNPVTYVIPGMTTRPFVGIHFMPIGFVYGLVYRLFPSVYTTVVIYAVSFTVAGLFVYLFARALTHSGAIALGLQITYLAVFTPTLGVFYFEDWSTSFIAAGLYFSIKRRYGWATAMWLLAMMFKEYIGLAVAAFGISAWLVARYSSFRQVQPQQAPADKARDWISSQGRFGLLWAGMGLFWFVIAFFGIMRWLEPAWADLVMFSELGHSDSSIALSVLSNPGLILQRMAAPLGREYLIDLFLPLAVLPLLGFEYTIAILPILFLNFLPDGWKAVGINGHYTTMVQPFLLAGTAAGIVRLRNWLHPRPRSIQFVLTAVVAIVVTFHAAQGIRLHAYKLRVALVHAHTLALHTQDVNKVLSFVPANASVAADEYLLPFLSHRQVVVHWENIQSVQPHYLLPDTFYDEGLIEAIKKGLELRWKLYDYPASDFYDSQVWENTTPAACECIGYHIIYRRGSLALFAKD